MGGRATQEIPSVSGDDQKLLCALGRSFLVIGCTAQCAFWVLRWPCGQNGPVYATGPYYVAHVVDTGP